jgi:hypothetical protein
MIYYYYSTTTKYTAHSCSIYFTCLCVQILAGFLWVVQTNEWINWWRYYFHIKLTGLSGDLNGSLQHPEITVFESIYSHINRADSRFLQRWLNTCLLTCEATWFTWQVPLCWRHVMLHLWDSRVTMKTATAQCSNTSNWPPNCTSPYLNSVYYIVVPSVWSHNLPYDSVI